MAGLVGADPGPVIPARPLGPGADAEAVPALGRQGADDVIVTLGGTIPSDDVKQLKDLGVAEVFTPGASTQQAVEFIRGAVRA